jgi:hypothetical protein
VVLNKLYSNWISTVVLILLLVPSKAVSQTSLDVPEKLQYLQALTGAAQAALEKGDLPESQRLLTACIPLVHILKTNTQSPNVAQSLTYYQKVHDTAWKGATTLSETDLEAFLTKLKKQKYTISQIRKNFESTPDSWPQGTKEFRRFIANMLAQQKSATEFFYSLAKETPPPLLLYQKSELYQRLYIGLFKPGYDVAIGPDLAARSAKEKVVPETQKAVETQLKESKESKTPEEISSITWELFDALSILDNIDLAMKAEGQTLEGLSEKVVQLRGEIETEMKRANTLFDEQIAKNRMPSEIWQNGPRTSMVGPIKRAYKVSYPKDEVLRLSLLSNRPSKQWEMFWSNEKLIARYAMYVKVATAVKQPSGEHRVFLAWYKRSRLNSQGWSGWSYSKNMGAFQILPENISK